MTGSFCIFFFCECEVTPARTTCFSVMYMLDIEKAVPQGESKSFLSYYQKPSRSIQSIFQFVAGHTRAIGAKQHRGKKHFGVQITKGRPRLPEFYVL